MTVTMTDPEAVSMSEMRLREDSLLCLLGTWDQGETSCPLPLPSLLEALGSEVRLTPLRGLEETTCSAGDLLQPVIGTGKLKTSSSPTESELKYCS